jgi:hypothetical protein
MKAALGLIAAVALLAVPGCAEDDAPGGVATGEGYRVVLPEGWEQQSAESLARLAIEARVGERIDSIWVRSDRLEGFQPNVNVVTGEAPPGSGPRALAASTRRALRDQAAIESRALEDEVNVALVGPLRRTGLGGEVAYEFEFRNDTQTFAGELEQRQLVTVRRGRVYVVTLSAREGSFEQVEPDFERILESWSWRS